MFKVPAALIAFAFAATSAPAFATTISVGEFETNVFAALEAGGSFVGEDFEGFGATLGETELSGPLSTAVGTFDTLGGTGSGSTVRGLPGNTGTELAIRDGNTGGRVNTVPTDGRWYLDSNDTHGMVWQASTGSLFDTVLFTLVDGSDTGAHLRISAGATSFEQRVGGKLPNGNAQIVVITFDSPVSSAVIELGNYQSNGSNHRTNDGFSVDGLRVGVWHASTDPLTDAAPVPLPATGMLLVGAVAALGWRARRRKS